MRWMLLFVPVLLFLIGCGGGGSTTPPADPLAITNIVPSHTVDAGEAWGYAGDELMAQVEVEHGPATAVVWDFGGGAIPVLLEPATNPTIELGAPGTYTGSVRVWNAAGESASKTFAYTVVPESHRIQSITPSSPAGYHGQTVGFEARVDGTIEHIRWRFDPGTDGGTQERARPEVRLSTTGTHEVTVIVTFMQGPTVERTFQFDVIPQPWLTVQQKQDDEFCDLLVKSDGEILLLTRETSRWDPILNRYSPDLNVTRIPIATADILATWQHHFLPLPYASQFLDIEEHEGRLAVACLEQVGGAQPSDYRSIPRLAVSSSLRPAHEAHWVQSRIPPYSEVGDIALAGKPGGGWDVLLHVKGDLFWASTNASRPTKADWIGGSLWEGDYYFVGLTRLGTALICAASGNYSGTTICTAIPDNFIRAQETTPYQLASGAWSFIESADRIAAASGDTQVLVSTFAPPLSVDDWIAIDSGAQATTLYSATGIAMTKTQLLIAGKGVLPRSPSPLELRTFDLQTGKPLGSSIWLRESHWKEPIVLPLETRPLVGYLQVPGMLDWEDRIWLVAPQ